MDVPRMEASRGRWLLEAVLLMVAVAAMASSVIFLRLSKLSPAEISGWRMLIGALCFLPWVGSGWKGLEKGAWLRAVVAGIFLGLHFISWVMGARATSAANASLLVNLVPLVLPFLLVLLASERIQARDWGGSVLGVVGVLVVVGGSLGNSGSWRGDMMCLGSMLLLAVYIALGRKAAGLFPSTAAWVVPVFATASVTCFFTRSLAPEPMAWPPAGEWKWILLVVVCPTLLGHGLVARALRFWRGQVVGVATGGQFLFASIYGWFAFGELPAATYPIGAVLIVAGVWVVAGRNPRPVEVELAVPSPEDCPDNKSQE